MRRFSLIAAALAAASVAVLGPRDALAFCRSTTCDDPNVFAQCDEVAEGCEPLVWRRSCVGWSLFEGGSKKVPFDVAEVVIEEAFMTWQSAFCGPGIQLQYLGTARCDQVEYNSLAGNANVVMFRDDAWPHEGADHNIALTTVTFDVKTGEIYDADIEVNTAQFELTWEGETVVYDFLSIMTHEVGHFLGLSHSSNAEATMYRHYDAGSTAFRDLHDDDEKGICAAYPPFETMPPECNPIPRHGFSPDCSADQKEGKCSVAGAVSGGSPAAPPAGFTALLVAASALFCAGRRVGQRRARDRRS